MKSKTVFFTGQKKVELREIDVPDPAYDEIQAKTIANGICMQEVWQYNYKTYDVPFIPGHEGIGIVTKVGKDVRNIKKGDLVVTGRWSEYVNQNGLFSVRISPGKQPLECYLVEPLSCAVNAVGASNIYPGDRVIVFGAGYMGLLLLQLLNASPLSQLVVTDVKSKNLELASKFGATEIINTGTPEGRKRLEEFLNDPQFDIAYECSGAKEPLDWCAKLTRTGGTIGIYAWHHDPRTVDTTAWHLKGLKVLNVAPGITIDQRAFKSYERADRLMSTGKVSQKLLVTHKYRLAEISKAMEESTIRAEGFIKSVLVF